MDQRKISILTMSTLILIPWISEASVSVGNSLLCKAEVIFQESRISHPGAEVPGTGDKSGHFSESCNPISGSEIPECGPPFDLAVTATFVTTSELLSELLPYSFGFIYNINIYKQNFDRFRVNQVEATVGVNANTWTYTYFSADYDPDTSPRLIEVGSSSHPTDEDHIQLGNIGKIGNEFTFRYPANAALLAIYPNALYGETACRID